MDTNCQTSHILSPGAAEGVRNWSDHSRKTSTTQLLVRLKFCKYKTLTANGKMFGSTKVGVVGPLPPALKSVDILAKMKVWQIPLHFASDTDH